MSLLQNLITTYKYNGTRGVLRKVKYKFTNGYKHYLINEIRPTFQALQTQCEQFEYEPKISAIIPVYQPDVWQLVQCIDSVLAQPYQQVEVVLSLDGIVSEEVMTQLQKLQQKDARIIIVESEINEGIAVASNKALASATGEYVMLIDQDDMLAFYALVEVVSTLQEKQYDFVYSDEDMITEQNKRFSPQFKPDWSPHTLLSRMYVNHLSVYKKEHIDAVGGFRKEYDGSQDFDLLLRASRHFQHVKHIPKVLYHWRTSENSIASDIGNKSYIFEKAQNALKDYFQNDDLEVKIAPHNGMLVYDFEIEPKGMPVVSIIIPFKEGFDLTQTLLDSILKYAGYENFEIILINNQSSAETVAKIEAYIKKSPMDITCIDADYAFNYSKINNQAFSHAKGSYLLFLNNDIEWFEENTLKRMLGVAMLKNTGAIGCKLLYPNGSIQHAGVVLGYHEVAGHYGVGQAKDDPGYYGRNISLLNVSAVTAACLLVEKSKFEQVGGFDETLAVAYQDVDFCLKLLKAGYYNVHDGHIQMYHHESVTRGFDAVSSKRYQGECQIMQERYPTLIENDPYYNRNLSVKVGELFQIKGDMND